MRTIAIGFVLAFAGATAYTFIGMALNTQGVADVALFVACGLVVTLGVVFWLGIPPDQRRRRRS